MAFENAVLGQYIPAHSPIHSLDPRAKILIAAGTMAAIFMTSTLSGFLLWAAALFFVTRLSHIPMSAVLRAARPVAILVVFTSLLHLFMTPGRAIISLGPVSVTAEGVYTAAVMSLRLILLVMFASMLTLTTTPARISDGLERLLSPLSKFGVPSSEIAMMITIALRFIPTLFEETGRIIKAQKSRGADFDSGGLMKRARAYIPVLIPLFVIIFKRAESLAVAMEARGYSGGMERTRLHPLVWRPADGAASLAFIAAAAAILTADRLLG